MLHCEKHSVVGRVALTARLRELDFPTMPQLVLRRDDIASEDTWDAWQDQLVR